MEGQVLEMKMWKMYQQRETSSLHATTLRITGSLFTMVMLLWAIRRGFNLATVSGRYHGYADWVFAFGVVTMVLGFLFLLLGIPILADLFLNFSHQLQEKTGFHEGSYMFTNVSV